MPHMFSDLGATIQDTAAMSKAELDFRMEASQPVTFEIGNCSRVADVVMLVAVTVLVLAVRLLFFLLFFFFFASADAAAVGVGQRLPLSLSLSLWWW